MHYPSHGITVDWGQVSEFLSLDEKIRPTIQEIFLGTVGWEHGGRMCQMMTRMGMMHRVFEKYDELRERIKDTSLRLLRACQLVWEDMRANYNDVQLKCLLDKMR